MASYIEWQTIELEYVTAAACPTFTALAGKYHCSAGTIGQRANTPDVDRLTWADKRARHQRHTAREAERHAARVKVKDFAYWDNLLLSVAEGMAAELTAKLQSAVKKNPDDGTTTITPFTPNERNSVARGAVSVMEIERRVHRRDQPEMTAVTSPGQQAVADLKQMLETVDPELLQQIMATVSGMPVSENDGDCTAQA